MVLDEEQSLQTKSGYMRRTVCCNFGSAACVQKHEEHSLPALWKLKITAHQAATTALLVAGLALWHAPGGRF